MEIGIIGAGVQGFSTAILLSTLSDVSRIILCDRDSMLLTFLSKKIHSRKINPVICDVTDLTDKITYFSNCDIIIDLLPPKYSLNVMNLALKINAHYINSAYDEPFWSEIVHNRELSMNEDFRQNNKTALLGFGYSPGLVNVITRKYCDMFDSIESVEFYGTYLNDEFDNASPWIIQWSPEQALKDYFTKPCVYCNGRYDFVELFSERELFDFGSFGVHSVCLHSHEEVYSIPRTIGKHIKSVRFKYQYNDFFEKLSRFGFLPTNSIDLNGQVVKPFDVLVHLVPKPLYYYLCDSQEPESDYVSIVVIVGMVHEKRLKFRITIPTPDCTIPQINPEVAIPIATACRLLSFGLNRGILFAEQVSSNLFLSELNKLTYFRESCTTEEI